MSLVFNDTTNRQGIVQGIEDLCGLGATGITGNTSLFQQITRFVNLWHKKGMAYAIQSANGATPDDPNYTTSPSGTFAASSSSREYYFDGALKMLRIRRVERFYDSTHSKVAEPFDNLQRQDLAVSDADIDGNFSASYPAYDLIANGFKLYPIFTATEVTNGAKVYVEFDREPREFATTGTDAYTSGLESQFDDLLIKGPALEYAKLYKPGMVTSLTLDIYGNNGNIKGLLKELQEWYGSKQVGRRRMTPLLANCK